MCENADYELPSIDDCGQWADAIGVEFPVVADEQGQVCPAWEYPEGVTTVFVLDGDGVLAARHDSTDPEVVDTVRDEVEALLSP